MKNRILLISGAAGFLGRYVAQHFTGQGWIVVGVDTVSPENAPVSHLAVYYDMSLPSPALDGLLKEHSPAVFINCAGRASVPLSFGDPRADFSANTALTFEILDSLRLHCPDCRFIMLSSAAVYGNPATLPVSEVCPPAPISPYGFHKWQAEQACLEFAKVFGMATATVRIFSAYGPGLRRQVLWDMCQRVLLNKELIFQGTGAESRDFIHAADVARGLAAIAENAPMEGEVYNLASGIEVTIRELATMIFAALGCDSKPEFDGIVPEGTPLNWRADISRLQAIGFRSLVPFEQGVNAYAKWCRSESIGL